MVEKILKIISLDCLACARGLESSVVSLTSIEEAKLEYLNGMRALRVNP